MPFWRKKPWEKVACVFVVQENLPGGTTGGWPIITQASGEIPTKSEASEFFKPGRHYRVMARAIEDNEKAEIKAGTFIGVVWKHYEPLPGGVPVIKPKAEPSVERKVPSDPSELIDKWAKGFQKQLEPITTFAEAMGDLREALAAIVGPPAGGAGPPAGVGEKYTVSPLEYEGKAPWMLHPQVVETLSKELKGLIEYGADRLEGIMGGKGLAPETEEVEEEELVFPSLIDEEPAEEIVEEVVEEEIEVPVEAAVEEIVEETIEAPVEVPVEAPLEEAETIPSLLEKDLPCAQCGRTDVPLLPSGLCEKCAKEISESAPEEGKENE